MMHEDLVGYLLDALEPHEMRRIAELLQKDPAARAELRRIEEALRPLEDASPIQRPSSDLVSRTLDNLPPLPKPGESPQQDSDANSGELGSLTPMGSGAGSSGRSTMSWMDWVSGAVAVAILLGLLLPSIAQGRFESRKAACQDQLRQFGTALTYFVTRNHQERFPAVSPRGPEAFAGIYAVRLYDAGLLVEPGIRWCPSLDPPSDEQLANQLVSTADLHSASQRLKKLQLMAGGHYAYTLGVVDNNRLTPPKFSARANFAVMSDAPMAISKGEIQPNRVGHSGRGINVLYEDGHTRFYTLESLRMIPDHPLMNNLGHHEAGVNVNDASLAPSWRPPFVNVKQR